jgi:hypothetical protein
MADVIDPRGGTFRTSGRADRLFFCGFNAGPT